MRAALIVASTLALAGAVALAQPQQVVTPPKAVYWASVDTVSGFGAMAFASRAQMMSGNVPTATRTLHLELGSTLAPASGAPDAAHDIPPGLQMGRALDLKTPVRERPAEQGPGSPPDLTQIKGRLLLFWGCGERVGAGQPLIVDFASVQRGQIPSGLTGATVTVNIPRGPSASTSRTFGEWPHAESRSARSVPQNGSLVGAHFVHGNYTPDIRFNLSADRDFMAPVQLTQAVGPSGAVAMQWTSIPNATGYFATVIGGMMQQGPGGQSGGQGSDTVIWTSSARKMFGGPMSDWVPPGEVARLVSERVFLAPATTTCTVPAEVRTAAPQGMLMFNAFGPEANFVHPPRPADVRTPWNQEWVVKVRFKSSTMSMLGQNGTGIGAVAAGMGGMTPDQAAEMQRQQCEMRRQQQGGAGQGMGGAIGSATGIPGAGMVGGALGKAFGKKKQDQQQPADPNCP